MERHDFKKLHMHNAMLKPHPVLATNDIMFFGENSANIDFSDPHLGEWIKKTNRKSLMVHRAN